MGRGIDALLKAPGPLDTIRFPRMFDEGEIMRKSEKAWLRQDVHEYPARFGK
jgi:hypothetical protein